MKVLIIEPYLTGSHAAWVAGYKKFSRNEIEVLSLPGRYWKWRMHGGAVTLAKKFLAGDYSPDLILATDMLDLTTLLGISKLAPRNKSTPVCLCACVLALYAYLKRARHGQHKGIRHLKEAEGQHCRCRYEEVFERHAYLRKNVGDSLYSVK